MVGRESVGRFGEFRRSNGGCYQVGINRAKFSRLWSTIGCLPTKTKFILSSSISSPSSTSKRNDPKNTDLRNE